VAINGVSVDGAGTSVTLSLASSIASTIQVKVSYSDPTTANDATGAIEDLAGNDLASRSATAVSIFLSSTSVTMASGFHSGYKGVELTAAAGNASLSGNASANDLTGNDAPNVLSGGGAADALTGGAGADEFLFASNSESLLGTTTAPRYDRIRDLVIGTDTITMATAFAAPAGSISHRGTASALSEAAIATLLPTTNFAAAFSLGSGATTRSFLVLNDSLAGFQAATDGLIEITGFSGNLGGLAIL
jgi:Ca2+-binding RTX toxin-like protein